MITLDLQIACNNGDELPLEADIHTWLNRVFQQHNTELELTIRLVDEKESQELNKQYRDKDYPTNVLSFPFESPIDLPLPLLGDLVICKQVVERQAKEQHKTLLSHWAHMVVHGCLHLLAYDHIEETERMEMESLEIAIMKDLGFANPYEEGQEHG